LDERERGRLCRVSDRRARFRPGGLADGDDDRRKRATRPLWRVSCDVTGRVGVGSLGHAARSDRTEVCFMAKQSILCAALALSALDVLLPAVAAAQVELTTEGPLLLASLPAGDYTLTAELPGWQGVQRSLSIGEGSLHTVYVAMEPQVPSP
jgi:hypothetical protein